MSHFSKMFVIDDDEIARFLLMTKLEDLSFADEYRAFDNAVEALDFLKQHKESTQELPDLIFLDINMPEMNSWEFLESYKPLVSVFPKKVYLCILTSSVFEKDMERAHTHPLVNEYLIKPVQKESLDELVKKYASPV